MLRNFPRFLLFTVLLISGSAANADLTIDLQFLGTRYGTNPDGRGGSILNEFAPPDTMGAVGQQHIVEILNGSFAIYDKSNGSLIRRTSLDDFWTSAGAEPDGDYAFDPRIVFDANSQRWYAVAVDNKSGPNNVLLGVSSSPDPTDAWAAFQVDADTTGPDDVWADFPTLGYDAHGVYVAANMFPIASGFANVSILAVPKDDLLASVPTIQNAVYFENVMPIDTGFSLQSVIHSSPDNVARLLSAYSATQLKWTELTGTDSFPVSLDTTSLPIAVPSSGSVPDAPQPNGAALLDTRDERFSASVIQQGNSIWAAQSVRQNNRAVVRWFELDAASGQVVQSGTIADPIRSYYYPSIAVNANGDVVIGFTGSSPIEYASAYVVSGSTVAGVTSFQTPIPLFAGNATYERFDSSGRNRWGDYSSTVLDPLDPHSFWTFQLFVSGANQWQVGVTKLSVSAVPEPSGLYLALLAGISFCGVTNVSRWIERERIKVSRIAFFSRNRSPFASNSRRNENAKKRR